MPPFRPRDRRRPSLLALVLAFVLILLAIQALLTLCEVRAAWADSASKWQRWTGDAWADVDGPRAPLRSPRLDDQGNRYCPGVHLRHVEVRRIYRNKQCVVLTDYAYWCHPVEGMTVTRLRAKDAPACGPSRAIGCKESLVPR